MINKIYDPNVSANVFVWACVCGCECAGHNIIIGDNHPRKNSPSENGHAIC